jgi:hypothetical protein
MAYLVEILLFLLPFAAYGLWRRMNPRTEPSLILLVLAAAGVVLMVGGGIWYGLSRSLPPGANYVPATLDGDHIAPGHGERPR